MGNAAVVYQRSDKGSDFHIYHVARHDGSPAIQPIFTVQAERVNVVVAGCGVQQIAPIGVLHSEHAHRPLGRVVTGQRADPRCRVAQ